MIRTVAVRLKIPDNEAYTAMTALRRLGVEVEHVERAQVLQIEDDRSDEVLLAELARDESLVNPNKHELHLLPQNAPRDGEVWIEEMGETGRYTAWRLFTQGRVPAGPAMLRAAIERLLCNPAIERARTQ